jgi:hypothetical protein
MVHPKQVWLGLDTENGDASLCSTRTRCSLGPRAIREMMTDHHVRFFDIEDIDPLVAILNCIHFRPSDARPVLGGA